MRQRTITRKRQASRGFTLIELLVVVAIIAILAAILFPLFAKARAKANQTTCMNNQRQLAVAVMMSIQDQDETLPGVANSTGPEWRSALQQYIGDEKLYDDPTLPSNGGLRTPEYGMNGTLQGVALADITTPAETILITDCKNTQSAYITLPSPTAIDTTRHPGGFVAAFADGHVELVPTANKPFYVPITVDPTGNTPYAGSKQIFANNIFWTTGLTCQSPLMPGSAQNIRYSSAPLLGGAVANTRKATAKLDNTGKFLTLETKNPSGIVYAGQFIVIEFPAGTVVPSWFNTYRLFTMTYDPDTTLDASGPGSNPASVNWTMTPQYRITDQPGGDVLVYPTKYRVIFQVPKPSRPLPANGGVFFKFMSGSGSPYTTLATFTYSSAVSWTVTP